MAKLSQHYFYCINCGQAGLPVWRAGNKFKEKFHRKKLYCFTCHAEVNHVECRNQGEINEFLEDYRNGVYVDEAKESLDFVRNSGLG